MCTRALQERHWRERRLEKSRATLWDSKKTLNMSKQFRTSLKNFQFEEGPTFFDTAYDRVKVPLHDGHDPRPPLVV